nr:MAG TPA: hypothetical protein [Caudoviricetes sp.]
MPRRRLWYQTKDLGIQKEPYKISNSYYPLTI